MPKRDIPLEIPKGVLMVTNEHGNHNASEPKAVSAYIYRSNLQ